MNVELDDGLTRCGVCGEQPFFVRFVRDGYASLQPHVCKGSRFIEPAAVRVTATIDCPVCGEELAIEGNVVRSKTDWLDASIDFNIEESSLAAIHLQSHG